MKNKSISGLRSVGLQSLQWPLASTHRRLAVNFTAGLAFSRLRSRLSRYFRGDGGLAFSLRSCSFGQCLHFCYVFAYVTFVFLFVNIFYIKKTFSAYRKFYQKLGEALLKPSQKMNL